MLNNIVARQQIFIKASPARVWDALTDPKLIKQYLFGTETKTDWKVGSPIIYTGVWEGEAYQDKGTILEYIPNQLLRTSYWSGFSGKPDLPENYATVSYSLVKTRTGTELTITQDNLASPEAQDHSERNWKLVLLNLKRLLEQPETKQPKPPK